jgi:ABC-type transport system substrate-binding protein
MYKYGRTFLNVENMKSSIMEDSATGAILAAISFILIFSAVPIPAATAAGQTYFSFTLIAPTSNPVRRQWASIIASSFESANIGVNLVFTSFSTLINRAFIGPPWPNYNDGGFDALFIGFGGGTPLPDFGTNNVLNYRTDDFAPNGNNYMAFSNSTYDNLANQYAASFSVSQRTTLALKMNAIIAQQRPTLVIEYPALVTGFASNIYPWNQQKTYTESVTGQDIQHFKVLGSNGQPNMNAVLNIAETGDINSVNPLPTSTSNSIYDRYLYGMVSAGLEELNPTDTAYIMGAATSITSSADHLTWTVSFTPHTFWDGVTVTSDDYLFSMMAQLTASTGAVGLGTYQTLLGLNTKFTLLNGTTRYTVNGTFDHTAPANFVATSTYTSTSANTFTFTMPAAYAFTDPTLTGIGALPMHIMEKVPFSSWATAYFSTIQNKPTTVTWSTTRYGGNGSYAYAYGPVGDGPYMYRGYDSTAGVGTLVRFANYWNATGLQKLGEFGIQTIHVDYIAGKDSAIAAFKNGQVNMMDGQYTFNNDDISEIATIGGYSTVSVDPSSGFQEMGFNLQNPYFGTGTGTPLGTATPAKAAFAAMMVREAMSYLVPRTQIIQNLLQGLAAPGITQVSPSFAWAYPPSVQADPYNPTQALSFLAAAGYKTGVAPPQTGGTITIPTPPTVSGVTIPSFLLGNTFTLAGTFSTNPTLSYTSGGFAVLLEQSTNNKNWTDVAVAGTTPGSGAYTISYTPTVTGQVYYRTLFTGIPFNTIEVGAFTDPTIIHQQLFSDFGGIASSVGTALNATDPQYGPTSSLTVGSFGSVISSLVTNIDAALANSTTTTGKSLVAIQAAQTADEATIATLQGSLNTLQTTVNNLNSTVNTLTDVAYAALAVAIILGLIAIVLSMRRPKVS